MTTIDEEILSPELTIAIAYTPSHFRAKFASALALDTRLSRILAASNEPMLAQMRLAWWRERLSEPVSARPSGDVVLDAIGSEWREQSGDLVALVDGWEHLLGEGTLARSDALEFAQGRSIALMASVLDEAMKSSEKDRVKEAATIWALADLAVNVSDEEEKAALLDLGLELAVPGSLPKAARGIAVLAALGRRSLERGGRPLMEGRLAGITALRAGIFGR